MSYETWASQRYDGTFREEPKESTRIYDLEYIPIYIISQYIWAEALRQDKASIWGIINPEFSNCPFFPDVPTDSSNWYDPTANPTGAAYAVYDYVFVPTPNSFWPVSLEQARLDVVAPSNQLNQIKNFIYDTINRYDTAAERVNEWIANGINSSGIDTEVGISFKNIRILQGSYINETEGYDYKRNSSALVVMYEYTKS